MGRWSCSSRRTRGTQCLNCRDSRRWRAMAKWMRSEGEGTVCRGTGTTAREGNVRRVRCRCIGHPVRQDRGEVEGSRWRRNRQCEGTRGGGGSSTGRRDNCRSSSTSFLGVGTVTQRVRDGMGRDRGVAAAEEEQGREEGRSNWAERRTGDRNRVGGTINRNPCSRALQARTQVRWSRCVCVGGRECILTNTRACIA